MSHPSRAFFVTGTDTEIGKTLVSSALVYAMVQQGWSSVGMKPVAAGAELIDGSWRNEDVEALLAVSKLAGLDSLGHLINPYLFRLAAAPHVAAQAEGREIDLAHIVSSYNQLAAKVEAIVVEGVGGFRVPLNERVDTADMAQQLQLPVILVVGMRLGCISHALLSAEAIAARGLTLVGWVANSAQREMAFLPDNLRALRERIDAPLLGSVPYLPQATAAQAAQYLDFTTLFQSGN